MARAERFIEPWAVGVIAVLALGLSGPIAFLWIALHAPPERVATDPWRSALAQDAEERVRGSGRNTGWDVSLSAERTATGVRVSLAPATTRSPLPDDLVLRLRRERPERSDLDAEIPLEHAQGRWTAEVPLPAAGRWRLLARAGAGEVWIERSFGLEVSP